MNKKKYISKQDIISPSSISKRIKLNDICPQIFLPKYSLMVCKTREPVIVESNVGLDPSKVILFPRTNEFCKQYWFYSGFNQKYPYIGVVRNNFCNNDKFPYLICCFETNQTKKPTYKDYMDNIIRPIIGKNNIGRIVHKNNFTNPNGQLGCLPIELQDYLGYNEESNRIFRKGFLSTDHSILECILYALNIDEYQSSSDDCRVNTMNLICNQLMHSKHYNIGRYALYDMNDTQIRGLIKIRMNPRKFRDILESFFNINIIIFESNENQDIDYLKPRNKFSNLVHKYDKNKPCILLYYHQGGIYKSEKKCELIVQQIGKMSSRFWGDQKYIFDFEYCQKFKEFQSDVVLLPGNVIGQYINHIGEVDILLINNNINGCFGQVYIHLNEPILPLNVDCIYEWINDQDLDCNYISNLFVLEKNDPDLIINDQNKYKYFIKYKTKSFDIYTTPKKHLILQNEYMNSKKLSTKLIKYIEINYAYYLMINYQSIDFDYFQTFDCFYKKFCGIGLSIKINDTCSMQELIDNYSNINPIILVNNQLYNQIKINFEYRYYNYNTRLVFEKLVLKLRTSSPNDIFLIYNMIG